MRSETTIERPCRGCGLTLPLNSFSVDRSQRLGRNTRCRGCRGATNKAYKAANRPRLSEYERYRRDLKPRRLTITGRSIADLNAWGDLLSDQRALDCWDSLGLDADHIWLQHKRWRPTWAPPRHPMSACDRALCEQANDMLDEADKRQSVPDDEDDVAVVDADGWVFPWWLKAERTPRLSTDVVSSFAKVDPEQLRCEARQLCRL
jgi:hypothetical protein